MTVQIVALLVALIGGGAMGALMAEWFRRRRGRTRAIPVIERVNRNPVASELKGIKLFRLPAGPGEAPVEISNIREYQLTLRNTSDKDLRGAEIQFEFSSEDVEPWVSRPVLSKAALKRMEGAPSEPWKKAMRWQVPQFPPGDSVEFSFQVVDPATEEYEVALYNIDNLVLKRTQGEPTERSVSLLTLQGIGIGLMALTAGVFAAVTSYEGGRLAFRHSATISPADVSQVQTALPPKSADETEIEQIVTASQKFKYLGLFRDPKSVDRSAVSKYWIPAAQGGEASEKIIAAAQRLAKHNLTYGSESKSDRFEVLKAALLSPEYAKVSTFETWYLTVYGNGAQVQGCTPNFDFEGLYELRKINGRWLIQSEHGLIDGPDDCAIRARSEREK
jgi:hypothetical protein